MSSMNYDSVSVDVDDELDSEINRFNFVNRPWDDRTTKSKLFLVLLLLTIMVLTLSGVIINIQIQFSNADKETFVAERIGGRSHNESSDDMNDARKVDQYNLDSRTFLLLPDEILINGSGIEKKQCELAPPPQSRFVAAMLHADTRQLICSAAILALHWVLTAGQCVSFCVPDCQKQLLVHTGNKCGDRIMKRSISVPHEADATGKLTIIQLEPNGCKESTHITISTSRIKPSAPIYNLGWAHGGGTSLQLFLQSVFILDKEHCVDKSSMDNSGRKGDFNEDEMLCVLRGQEGCITRHGDLMVQDGLLYGVAGRGMQTGHISIYAKLSHLFDNITKVQNTYQYL